MTDDEFKHWWMHVSRANMSDERLKLWRDYINSNGWETSGDIPAHRREEFIAVHTLTFG